MFSQGELSCDGHEIRVFDFLTQRSTKLTASSDTPRYFGMTGHGGADYHLMDAFISAVAVSAYKYFHVVTRIGLFGGCNIRKALI